MAWQVVFTRRANCDVGDKEQWLARLGARSVARWRGRLLSTIEKLETDPLCYPRADEADDLGWTSA